MRKEVRKLNSANRRLRFADVPETASEETLESPIESKEQSTDRWHALDEFLIDSFGRISPAYLFMCFPPSR
jgi:hypothetical protein